LGFLLAEASIGKQNVILSSFLYAKKNEPKDNDKEKPIEKSDSTLSYLSCQRENDGKKLFLRTVASGCVD
jgi:hypothetical protein